VIIALYSEMDIILVRTIVLAGTIINGLMVILFFRRIFPKITFRAKPDASEIVGTNDIVVQQVVHAIASAAPILFISIFYSTAVASVYAVYFSIYNIVKFSLTAVAAAPISGFGHLLASASKSRVYGRYKTYEFLYIIGVFALMTAVAVMLLPFVAIYTYGVTDVNYFDRSLALLMMAAITSELLILPTHNLMNVSGQFAQARWVRTVGCLLLVPGVFLGSVLFGVYGIIIAIILANLVMLFMAVSFIHRKYFKSTVGRLVMVLCFNAVIAALLIMLGNELIPVINSFISFGLIGLCVFAAVCLSFLVLNGAAFYISFFDAASVIRLALKRRVK
jgi:hypothetical protein